MSAHNAIVPDGERRVASGQPPEIVDRGPLNPDVVARLPLELDADQLRQLARYRDLLLGWNERINLTAVTDPADVEQVLLLDALHMAPEIGDFATRFKHRPTLIDIGAGGGLPGIPLAIALPGIDFTLLDATGKKVMVLGEMARDLGLPNVRALHGRAEEIGHLPDHRARYDLATARAVASLPALVELALPLLKRAGRAWFPKSATIDEELRDGEVAAEIVGGRIESSSRHSARGNDRVTRMIVLVKMNETPQRFPRRAGLPAKEPLGRGKSK
jgi:16S rRNA (guanine527-N7)-methyltransferase